VFSRLDFAADAWNTQDQATFLSWWRQSVPQADQKRRTLKLDAASLARIFADLKEARDRPSQCFCYVVALCLARMRKLRILEVEKRDGESYLLLQDRANQAVHRLRDPRMTAAEEDQVRRNLMDVITLDGPAEIAPAAEADPS
jgi:hypothetical protein